MPSNSALLWLIVGLTLGSIPHFIHQPIWVSLTFFAMIGWRALSITHHWPLPKKRFSLLSFIHLGIAASAIAMMVYSYGNLIGRDAGIALLTVMLSLKIVEIRNHRDYYISCFLGYFLVVTNFFYSQNMPTALLMFAVVLILTASLIRLNDEKSALNNKGLIKLSGQMLLQAMPLMLLLFVLFPRIPGPLWGIPQDAHSATTGIDNKMRMGSISDLALSEQVAFRVKFEGDIPKQADRYWRGPVLWNFDGSTWTEFENKEIMSTPPTLKMAGDTFNYTTTIEPNDNNWLFALDFPLNPDAELPSYLQYDGQLKTIKPLSQRQQVTLQSNPNYIFNADDDILKNVALELPFNKHPKTRDLAESWANKAADPLEIVTLALTFFKEQGFVYTLQPPLLVDDKIDAFLFETKQGFCEHFAASFTVLMRAAGVPARVVTGYQGGELNPVDNYLTIRQYDAHAWSEVWIAGIGWKRIDPTSAVSRQRITQGISQTMPNTFNQPPAFIPKNKQVETLWRTIKNNLNAVDNAWNQWVLDYGPSAQKSLLKKLGMSSPSWQNMVIWLMIGFFIVSVLISMYLFYNRPNYTPEDKLYSQFCRKAARAGYERQPSQGPLDFARVLIQHYPHHHNAITHITSLYIDLKYGIKQHSLAEFKAAIHAFKFKKRPRKN